MVAAISEGEGPSSNRLRRLRVRFLPPSVVLAGSGAVEASVDEEDEDEMLAAAAMAAFLASI
jgi:hypothetical protein